MKYFKSNASDTRIDFHEGQEYLVVPVVMARAGVEMNGAVINEDQLHAESWNGVPVTIGHPKDSQGNDISANSPDTLNKYQVGTIFNAHVDDGKLKAEAWVNIDKADANLVARLKNMDAMDVSTGYFSDIENNEYKNIKPDHLALLPNDQGACNYNDGCGVRANKFQQLYTQMKNFFNTDKEIRKPVQLRLNQKGYKEVMHSLQSKLNEMDTPESMYYLVDMYDNEFIYEVDMNGQSTYYKRGYEVDDNGVKISGEPTKVQKEINYKPVTNAGINMIDELISNEASPFTEDDKDSLEAMSENSLKALTDQYKEKPTANSKEDAPKAPEAVLSNEDKEALQIARQARTEKREEYITHITANSSMCKDKLEAMDTNTLKDIAAGITPAADYSGRAFGVKSNSSDEDVVKAMTPPTTKDMIMNKRKQVN